MATSKSVDFSANQNDNKMQSQINNASEINRSDIKTPSSVSYNNYFFKIYYFFSVWQCLDVLLFPVKLTFHRLPQSKFFFKIKFLIFLFLRTLLNNQKKQNGFKDKMISLDVDEDCF